MAWLLDTNVISELRKVDFGKGDINVAAWQSSVDKNALYLSAVTIMELEIGILKCERKDFRQGAVLRRWLTSVVIPEFEARILSFDARIARQCAALVVPDPREWADAAVLATAMAHDMVLVTRNVRHFQGANVALFDPWTYGTGT